jgi:hypothetical protein
MAVVGDLLFYRRNGVDLDAVIRAKTNGLRNVVDALPERAFSQQTDEQIAESIAKSERIEPLELDFGAAVPKVEETQLELRGDDYGFRQGPVRVPALKATKTIPFKGEPDLWHLRTNPFNMNPPHGEVRGHNLIVGMTVRAEQPDQAAQYIEGALKSLPEYLERQRAQLKPYNEGLAANALQWVKQRRARLGQASDLLKKLGG